MKTVMALAGLITRDAAAFLHTVAVGRRLDVRNSPSSVHFGGAAPLAFPTVNIDEDAYRDIASFEDWAANCGVQRVEGLQLTSEDGGQDFGVTATTPIPAGTPLIFVPGQMIMSSSGVEQEFGAESLQVAEEKLLEMGYGDQISLFRLFVKILVECERGETSPYFSWLDSLPRLFFNGVSMTYACFDCLPPYAAKFAKKERSQFKTFHSVLHHVVESGLLGGITIIDRHLIKWAYNIALTRSLDAENGEKRIVPMVDMFNHGAEPEVVVQYDKEGNCMAYAMKDVPAGCPLRLSYGDPLDPSPLFAQYGFLDESSPATFCKLMHVQGVMRDLGYSYSDLLFFKNGDVSMEVYDVLLCDVLTQVGEQNLLAGFYDACMRGDAEAKNSYHEQCFPYTVEALQKHVDGTLRTLDVLSERARGYDLNTHPRVPVILRHNAFVKDTFLRVKANVDAMAAQCSEAPQ